MCGCNASAGYGKSGRVWVMVIFQWVGKAVRMRHARSRSNRSRGNSGKAPGVPRMVKTVGALYEMQLCRAARPGGAAASFTIDDGVAFAYARLQFMVIQHGDMAAPVADHAGFLQLPGRVRDAFAPHPEDAREQLMGQAQFV